jgi:SAM-dependent methyltransferase
MENRYVIRGGEAGFNRLKVLARSLEHNTALFLDRVSVRTGQHCLDLGCGGGDVTLELARRVGPSGSVVGVDLDEVKLELARADAARQGLSNVTFTSGDARTWAESSRYDLIYARNVLQHLPRPIEVVAAMWAGLRPGGTLAVEDADFEGSFCDPPNDGFAFWMTAYPKVLVLHGGDPLMGRKLFATFRAAGITDPQISVSQRIYVTGEAKAMPWNTIEATADAIVASGVASREHVDAALADLDQFLQDPTTMIGSPRNFQCWARRSQT